MALDPKNVASVTPPTVVRRRKSSVPQDIVDAMLPGIDKEHRTNGEVYKGRKAASNASSLYRTQVVRTLGVKSSEVHSRVWEIDADGNPVVGEGDVENGLWIFGLTTKAPANGNAS